MKLRRVVLTLEVETEAPLSTLRDARKYAIMDVVDHFCKVLQAQANVIVVTQATTRRRRKHPCQS